MSVAGELAGSAARSWRGLLAGAVTGFAGLVGALGVGFEPPPIPQPAPAQAAPWEPVAARFRTEQHEVVEGETASEVLRQMGAPSDALIAGAAGALNRLSVGDVVQLDFASGEPTPWRLRLDKGDPTVFALVRTGSRSAPPANIEAPRYAPVRIPVPYHIETGPKILTVTSSLWQAALDAGLRPSQIMGVASIFEYDVDFNSELLPGAVIQLAADTLTDDAGVSRVGDIRAARLQNGSKSYIQIRYRLAEGTVGWFKPDGTGARKPFLRSPLPFMRVTSGFSAQGRYHPILKRRRPHLGVDFGAPTGTPIRAVADGTVVQAGPAGGHGNHVAVQHAGPYSTGYSHLSAILVKRGQAVHQGDIIGRVGMTGLATGPHLHYEFFINGSYVNPMTVDLPNSGASELPEAEKEAFFTVRDAVMGMLE